MALEKEKRRSTNSIGSDGRSKTGDDTFENAPTTRDILI